jgi:protein gp37
MKQAFRIATFGSAPHYVGLTEKVNNNIVWTGKVARGSDRIMKKPLTIKNSAKIFVNSMSDFWHENASDTWRMEAINIMRKTPQHQYQVLTKRPENALKFFDRHIDIKLPDNFWAGVTVEHERTTDRIDTLRQIPAKTKFISFEPLIADCGDLDMTGIHWAITGGESGPGHRPCHRDWVHNIHTQTREQNVAHFFKQWGHWTNNPLVKSCPKDIRPDKWVSQEDPVGKGGSLLDGESWKEFP